jgi:hypothetical protein
MISTNFPAGVTTLLSRAAKINNWRDANLVRWDDGVTMRPIGGWEKVPLTPALPSGFPFASRCRAMHRWVALNGLVWTAYVCEQHCYVESGSTLTDITPYASPGVPSIPAITGDNAGYGELLYSAGNYGVDAVPAVASTIQKFSKAWSVDNWGQDLLVMWSYDGFLWKWSPSTPATPLAKVAAVKGTIPTANRQFVITPERHVMLFGGSTDGSVRFGDITWCSSEDITDWDIASITNTAGNYTVDPLSPIVAARLSSAGILVFTPAMTHVLDYIGLPYVYRIRPVGKVPIPISAASVTSVPAGIAWVSIEGFWLWNGTTADIVPCPLWDSISTRMDFGHCVLESSIVSMLNRGEVWWFWVDKDLGIQNSRYIALDYRSKIWMPGYLNRTCGITYGNDRFPIMTDGWTVWKHETGFTYPNALFMPYIESQTLNVFDGERWNTISKILPDIAGDKDALAFSIAMNNDRTDYSTQQYSARQTINPHGWVDIRVTARDARLRIDMIKGSDWTTVGPIIFDIKPRGKKK